MTVATADFLADIARKPADRELQKMGKYSSAL